MLLYENIRMLSINCDNSRMISNVILKIFATFNLNHKEHQQSKKRIFFYMKNIDIIFIMKHDIHSQNVLYTIQGNIFI